MIRAGSRRRDAAAIRLRLALLEGRFARPGDDRPLKIRIHYDHILPEDITTFEGIPITTPARTLLDIATSISHEELTAAVATALDRGLTTTDEIRAVIGRYPHHPGGQRLLALPGL